MLSEDRQLDKLIAEKVFGYEVEVVREIRKPNFWAVCTGPVSKPPEEIKRKGFQGFRYTADLW